MTEFQLGDYVSLQSVVGDDRRPGYCATKQEFEYPGTSKGCWHNTCKVIRIFLDNGVLIENGYAYVRRAEPTDLIKRH
jgi:hypothetical protein